MSKVLIVDGGGRGHALAWACRRADEIFVAPGNYGTNNFAHNVQNVPIAPDDVETLLEFADQRSIGLTIAGQDTTVAHGIGDRFRQVGLKVLAPDKDAARLETSKAFAKTFFQAEGIPTAPFQIADSYDEAMTICRTRTLPYVIKADGLAEGKGVFICRYEVDCAEILGRMLTDKEFGTAGEVVVIEDYLVGEELSVHVLCDGSNYLVLPTARDYKSLNGINTGGMGCFAPVPGIDEVLMAQIQQQIIVPTLKGLAKRGLHYVGCLYFGLMLTKQGPMLLEINARFGDPEAQVILPLLKTNFLTLANACVNGRLDKVRLSFRPGYTAGVVLASAGYPIKCRIKDAKTIRGLSLIEQLHNVMVFHAGTRLIKDRIISQGGRVLIVVGTGKSLRQARKNAYKGVRLIHFQGMQYLDNIAELAVV
ncbi:phosphoribosylamine--glycine ligase [Patescibacteria group bacterium]